MPFTPTEEQQAIINHDLNRHGRVLAGPGTGKSTTVVALIQKLQTQTDAPSLRMLTFTRAATAELAEKMSDALGAPTVAPATIHSFAIATLLANPGLGTFPEPLRLADDWENQEIVLPTMARRLGCYKNDAKAFVEAMETAWESLVDPELRQHSDADRARFLGVWEEHRRIFGYTLLAELPYRLRNALRGGSDLSGCEIDLLVVDEYQDLNACDLDVIRLLSERFGCRVLAIGDDDQSIYSFRSAAPEGIRRFPNDYEDAAEYPLTQTLRCGRRIIAWANHVIRQSTDRPAEKEDLQACEASPEGEVALYSFAGQAAEPRGIAQLTKRLIDQHGFLPKDILILLRSDRNRMFSDPIRAALSALEIPSTDASWVSALLAEESNSKFSALLRLLCNREDSLAWATILHFTNWVSDAVWDAIYHRAQEQGTSFGAAILQHHREGFPTQSTRARNAAGEAIGAVLGWLEEHQPPESRPEDSWSAWLRRTGTTPFGTATDEFFELVAQVDQVLNEDSLPLSRLLNQLGPVGKDIASARAEGVRVMTLASSKGLTVRGTIIAACEDGVIPRPTADRSEEARLMYVGMTRSKEVLYCTWARRRTGPTARAGMGAVRNARRHSGFFDAGPVISQRGDDILR